MDWFFLWQERPHVQHVAGDMGAEAVLEHIRNDILCVLYSDKIHQDPLFKSISTFFNQGAYVRILNWDILKKFLRQANTAAANFYIEEIERLEAAERMKTGAEHGS